MLTKTKGPTKNLLNAPIDFINPNSVKDAIQTLESSIYGGTNVDSENIVLMVQQHESLIVLTYQSNGWIRGDEYNADGLKEVEGYQGRWTTRRQYNNGELVKTIGRFTSKFLIIIDYDEEKQKYVTKLATRKGEIDKRSINKAYYVKEDALVKVWKGQL
ncbi:hypothetical protein [Viridibacillus arvi]|uniref:hypothetical protein n=1 Tax=Viridibacillus arvi TaxID=263475 RepID=UPI0034CE4927